MKKTDELKSMSIEDLTEKRRKLKKINSFLGGFMGVAFIFLVFTAIKSKNYALIAIVGGASLTLLPGISQLKEIDNELKERKQSQSFE